MKREKELVRTETYMIKTLHKQVLPPTFRQIRTKPKEMIAEIPYVTSRAKKKKKFYYHRFFQYVQKRQIIQSTRYHALHDVHNLTWKQKIEI